MSRSYKKSSWSGDKKGKTKKRIANHTVRQFLKRNLDLNFLPGDYKKIYSSWDICDFGGIYTWEQYWENEWQNYLRRCFVFPNYEHEEPDIEECYRKWAKHHKRK